jgi:hypothetical protein
MAAWVAPAIMAAGSVLSAYLGSSGAREANKIANLNYLNEQQANQLQQWYAQQAMRQAQAGQETATGSRMYYDAATNTWKTELSPMDQQLLNAEQQAQMQRLGPDEWRRARGQEQGYQRSLEADAVARAILGEMQDPQRITADQIYGDQLVRNYANYNQGMDDILDSVVKGSLATGQGSNAGDITAKAMRERRGQLPSLNPSMLEARMQAMGQHAAMRGDAANRYGAMTNLATRPDASLAGTGLSEALQKMGQEKTSDAARVSMGAMENTKAAKHGGILPDNDTALKIGSVSNALAGGYNWYNQNERSDYWDNFYRDAFDSLRQRKK